MGLKLFYSVKMIFFFFFILVLMPFPSSAQSEKPRLNVDQLIEEALQNNPEISAAKMKWEVFKEKIPQAYALEDPMFGFGIVSLPTNFSFKDEDMTMKEFSISQKFPFPGKRPLMREMASKEAEAVSTEIEEKNNRIIKEVKALMSTEPQKSHKGIKRFWRISPKLLRPAIPLEREYSRMCSRPMWKFPKWWMNSLC
jgi:hypothetical protein